MTTTSDISHLRRRRGSCGKSGPKWRFSQPKVRQVVRFPSGSHLTLDSLSPAALIEGYSQKATPGEVKVADMMTLIDFVGSKTRELRDALEASKANSVQLEASIKQLELEKESGKALPIHKRKSEDARNGRRRKIVRVLLEFEGDGGVAGRSEAARRTVTLKLIYSKCNFGCASLLWLADPCPVVHGATWTPSYDVRALSAGASSSTGEKKASEKGEKSPISVSATFLSNRSA